MLKKSSIKDISQYLTFAKKIALQAGKIMLHYFDVEGISDYKSDKTIVTIADKKINQFLIDKVKKTYPDHGVFGEESSYRQDNTSVLWVCDPIDGTAMFARGIPIAVFSLALVIDGKPILGVVYDPFTKRLYTAIKNQGAFCNKQPIHVNDFLLGDQREVSNFDLWAEAGLINTVKPIVEKLLEKSPYFICLGSVVQACMCVASGKFSFALFAGTKDKNVDIAAAKVIVEEAGGKVTNIFGEEQKYDQDIKGAIISNGVTHKELVNLLNDLQKK